MPYNLIRHLARSTRSRYMAMFTAYFDASGTKRSSIMAIAGFVAPTSQWLKFEHAWRKLLPPGISSFHMTDFVSSAKGWEKWKGKSSRRAWFIAQLADCIRKHIHKGFAVHLRLSEYRTVDAEYVFNEDFGPPYALMGKGILSQLRLWADKKNIDFREILCIFEGGDEDQGSLIKDVRAEGFNAISQTKEKIRAFDACDLAAWKAKSITDDTYVKTLHLKDPKSAVRILASLDQLEKDMGISNNKSQCSQ